MARKIPTSETQDMFDPINLFQNDHRFMDVREGVKNSMREQIWINNTINVYLIQTLRDPLAQMGDEILFVLCFCTPGSVAGSDLPPPFAHQFLELGDASDDVLEFGIK